MLMHLLMAALLIFLGYCLGRADEAMAEGRLKLGAGRTAPKGHNVDVTGLKRAARSADCGRSG